MRSDPVPEGVGGHLRAVVAADEALSAATFADEPFERGDGVIGVDPPVALDRQPLVRELVDHVQQLQDLPVGGLVELEGKRPDLIGALSAQALGRYRRAGQAPALSCSLVEARVMVEDFREDYNERRPRSALGMTAPARFAHAWKAHEDRTTTDFNDNDPHKRWTG